MNPTRRLLENLSQCVEISAPVLLFGRCPEQLCGVWLALADIAQPIRKSNCSAERHPDILFRIPAPANMNHAADYRPGCSSGVAMSTGSSLPNREPCQRLPPKVET